MEARLKSCYESWSGDLSFTVLFVSNIYYKNKLTDRRKERKMKSGTHETSTLPT